MKRNVKSDVKRLVMTARNKRRYVKRLVMAARNKRRDLECRKVVQFHFRAVGDGHGELDVRRICQEHGVHQ